MTPSESDLRRGMAVLDQFRELVVLDYQARMFGDLGPKSTCFGPVDGDG